MSVIKNFLKRQFCEPVVYARIAEMLRDGARMVRVKYRNCFEPRYYTGTGNPYNNCRGKRKRWTMTVQRLDHDNKTKVSKLINLGLPWMDGKELDVLLGLDFSNVASIEEVHFYDTDPEKIGTEITNIVRRLKPGQGYDFHGAYIKQDALQSGDFLLNYGATNLLLPENLLATKLAIPAYVADQSFDPKNISVADEKLIKRQHRPTSDLLRWLEIKQVPSVDDEWTVRFTHSDTAGAPVFYYSMEINIDNKSMKAHPFYITELVNRVLKHVRKIHGNGHYSLNQENIKITWNGETKKLDAWIDNVERYPKLLDEQPNVIYYPLMTEAIYKYGGGNEFKEV